MNAVLSRMFVVVCLIAGCVATLGMSAGAETTAVDVQSLVDAAGPGETVVVPAGVHVGAITIDHPVRLLGDPGASIDGSDIGSVITVDAADVEIAGLTVTGSGHDQVGAPSGILVTPRGDRANIHDVWVRHSYLGVTVQRAEDVVLERVSILGDGIISGELHATGAAGSGVGDGSGSLLRGDGIWLFNAPHATVRDCVLDTVRDGIYVSFGRDHLIQGNAIVNSRYAVHDMYGVNLTIEGNRIRGNLSGLVMMYGGPVHVTGNTITDSGSASTGFGAIVKDVGGVTLDANVLADNRIGLDVDDAGRTAGDATVFVGNTIALNNVGVLLAPSADPTFSRNAFIENTTQVVLHGTGESQAIWELDGAGNYWSDYGGFDAAGDGIGDVPYTRSGRTEQLIAANPLLLALASAPAFRLLMSVEDRWAPTQPTVDDRHPLTYVVSPALADAAGAGSALLLASGALMVVVGVWFLRGARRAGGAVRV